MSQLSAAGLADVAGARASWVRYRVVAVATLMAVLLYLDRFCISIMTPLIVQDLGLSSSQAALMLSAFFWTYALAQIPSGWLGDRFGIRPMLTIYILAWSLLTGLTGLVTSFLVLLGVRGLFGLAQAGAYPSSAALLSRWVPLSQRGMASAFVSLGGRVGFALASVMTVMLIAAFVPIGSVEATLSEDAILNPGKLAAEMAPRATPDDDPKQEIRRKATAELWDALPADQQTRVSAAALKWREGDVAANSVLNPFSPEVLSSINQRLAGPPLLERQQAEVLSLGTEASGLLATVEDGKSLSQTQAERLNRLLLEAAYPETIRSIYVQGWRPAIGIFGAIGLVVAGLFWLVVRERPEDHPRCNEAERQLIRDGLPPTAANGHEPFPTQAILTSPSLWALSMMQFFTNIGWTFLVTLLPFYLLKYQNVALIEVGLMLAIPSAMGWAGTILGGWVTDRLTTNLGPRWGRALPLVGTRFLGGVAFLLLLLPVSPWASVALFALVAFSTDFGNPAVWAYNQDVGGRYVGSILGWGNMWGNFGSAVSPLVVVWLATLGGLIYGWDFTAENVDYSNGNYWTLVFAVLSVSFMFSGLLALAVDATKPIRATTSEPAATNA